MRTSPDQRPIASIPELIAGYNVLRRLSMPRHPPYTLSSLTTFIDHRHSSTLRLKFAFETSDLRFSGRAGRNKRSITCQIAKKVLDDIRSIPPTERLSWGSRQ